MLKDLRSPVRLYQRVQEDWNRKSLIDDAGQKKKALGILREFYQGVHAKGSL